jgi:hypothetical protein
MAPENAAAKELSCNIDNFYILISFLSVDGEELCTAFITNYQEISFIVILRNVVCDPLMATQF